ncbi:hypothetical protein [Sphaerisporangium sp. TRM90804]|uniref:hypothetical protein n=1 Tax=Sphaerisporangium sp. TRM90804 TaxID=3031113 RepID=UPI00244AB763|nr:hypothetical protein [Sphaerisporangium sp. TRM90804]MDH2429295.1 hypothetical protein [Sphaerisporangium sp. TRM90804]
MSHQTRRRSNRAAAVKVRRRSTGGPAVLGGVLLSWLVYLGLSLLIDSGWAMYGGGVVFGLSMGLAMPRVRVAVESRR